VATVVVEAIGLATSSSSSVIVVRVMPFFPFLECDLCSVASSDGPVNNLARLGGVTSIRLVLTDRGGVSFGRFFGIAALDVRFRYSYCSTYYYSVADFRFDNIVFLVSFDVVCHDFPRASKYAVSSFPIRNF